MPDANTFISVEKNILTIQIDLDAETRPSSTGKTDLVATFNNKVDECKETYPNLRLNLNLYRKKSK